jgi:hypothetical protein
MANEVEVRKKVHIKYAGNLKIMTFTYTVYVPSFIMYDFNFTFDIKCFDLLT